MLDYGHDSVNSAGSKESAMTSVFTPAAARAEGAGDAAAWMLEIGICPGNVIALLCER